MTELTKKEIRQKRGNTLKRIFKDAKPISGGLSFSAVVSLVSIVVSLYAPMVLGQITDLINNYSVAISKGEVAVMDMDAILKISLFLLLLYFIKWVFSTINVILMNNIVSKFYTCATRIKISDKIRRLPISYIDATSNGEIVSRMTNDVSVMGNSIHTFVEMMITGFLQLIGIAVLMIRINAILALVILLIIPVSVYISAKVSKLSEQYFDEIQTNGGKMYSLLEESYSGYKTIKAYNLENSQIAKQDILLSDLKKSLVKGYYWGSAVQPIIAFTNSVAYAVVCLLGGYFAISGKISIGDVVAVILYSKLLSSPLEGIANGLSSLQRVMSSSKRVYEVLDEKEMEDESKKQHIDLSGDIKFENVNFSYTPATPLIDNLNLEVKKGQKVAIVGPTGGGKTTIVNLLMRFYEVNSGRISIGNVNIKDVSKENLHENISMVLQDTWLFSGTIFDNIAFGSDNATKEQVENACKLAYVDHFIRTLDKGYDTIIDEDSSNISSGQKQLLTIARAFMNKRPILILDEATSNIDTRTEVLIQKAMDSLMQDTTSFVIAHRLSTIVDADKIVVVNNGHIVEIGTHSELLAKNGFYAEIYNSQYSLLTKHKSKN